MATQLLILIVLGLWSAAAIGLVTGRRHPRVAVSFGRTAGVAAAALAMAATLGLEPAGSTAAPVSADRLASGIAVFVTLLSTVVGSFAARSLAADRHGHRFFALANLVTGSTVLVAVAAQPWAVAAGWVAVSLSTVALIAYDGRPGPRSAARRAATTFAVGDAAIAGAMLLAALTSDADDLSATVSAVGAAGGWAALTIGVLVTLAALTRSAQLPFARWLGVSVEAPTPVSAMLHAGVVNGSAIVLIRWHPVISRSAALTTATVCVAVAGILAGMAVGRTRPDVKSGLAWTTVAQMGFMTVQCALGLVGPAVVHLMAHGLFKSSLFLGTGSGLDGPGLHRHPTRLRPRATIVLAAAVAAAAVVATALAVVRPGFLDHPAGFLPVAFATATVAYGLVQWWTRNPGATTWAMRLAPLPVATVGFTALTALSSAVDHWLSTPSGETPPPGAGWLGAVTVATIVAVAVGSGAAARRWPHLAARAWMIVAAATVPTRRTPHRLAPAPNGDPHRSSSADDRRRARIRSVVGQAASELAPTWPLERFVATNPMLSAEHLPVEQATVRAASELGLRTELDETTYRSLHASGRISTADLRQSAEDSLRRSHVGGDHVDGDAVARLLDELLHAPPQRVPDAEPVLLSELHDRATGTAWADDVDEIAAWWCAAYLSDHPAVPLPGRETGFYAAWRTAVAADPRAVRRFGTGFAHLHASLPHRADDAVLRLLVELGVDRPDHVEYLRRHLHRLPGWSSTLVRASGGSVDGLVDLLAIRLAYEAALLSAGEARRLVHRSSTGTGVDGPAASCGRLAIWREAYERGYREQLLTAISGGDRAPTPVRPATQVVCCIDPRSEGLRRHLEAAGPHETIGFAGFFGLPISVTDLDAEAPVASCPVIVEPQAGVVETVTTAGAQRARRVAAAGSMHDVFATTKRSAAGPFALAETVGWLSGLVTAARTLAPTSTARAMRKLRTAAVGAAPTSIVPADGSWWSTAQQVDVAAAILRTTGLHHAPAELVVLCGHTSRHVNNLHRAALDCGACGGRGGGNNARTAANLLNDPDVRAGLLDRGIRLPADTWFVAAEHDTTADLVQVLDRHLVPPSHLAALTALERDLTTAGAALAAERGETLPSTVGRRVGGRPHRVQRRGDDWAQVIPEWGLVANAALVIGPRSLTAGIDLERRVFLHSYDELDDADGAILAGILAGPLQVAHWISSQYRLSTIDPERLGAGTKTAHNLVGGAGVIEGGGGDLRLGLPAESVGLAGDRVHEPMRLLVVIDASADHVDSTLSTVPAVATLVTNGWIRVVARPHGGPTTWTPWAVLERDGTWSGWPATAPEPTPAVTVNAAPGAVRRRDVLDHQPA